MTNWPARWATEPGKGLKQELVGKTVTLTLSRPGGRGAPAGAYVVNDGDATYFRCRATGAGFTGGEVVTRIRGTTAM